MKWENLKDWFHSKGRLQLLSVFLALVAWFVVHSGQTVKQRAVFPIQYSNVPAQLSLLSPPPTRIQTVLTGSLHRLRSIETEEIPYMIDFSNFEAGRHFVEIDPSNLRLPIDVRVSVVNPRRIEVELEEISRKEIPVQYVTSGQIADGFVISKVDLNPNPMQIRGPKSVVDAVRELRLEIDVAGRSESFTTALPVEWGDERIQSLDSILVEVLISKTNIEKQFDDVAVAPAGVEGRSIIIKPKLAQVILRGTEADLELASKDLSILVPVQGLAKGRYRLRGSVQLPPGLNLVSMMPESFIVEIE